MRFVSSCAAVILLAAAPAAHAQLPEQTPIDITPAITVRDPQPPTIVFNYGIEDLSLVNTYGGKDETTPGRVIAQEWATLKAVADIVRRENLELPGGTIRSEGSELKLMTLPSGDQSSTCADSPVRAVNTGKTQPKRRSLNQ